MAIIMGLVTVPRHWEFPKCCMFVYPFHGWFGHSWMFYHRPWTTSLSSMDILLIHGWLLILLALWVLNETFGWIGD